MRAAAPPPPILNRSHIPFVPGMDGNDQISDCTAAGYANAARAFALLNGFGIDIPTEDVVSFYSDSAGYDPTDPSTDQGAVELDVLAHQLKAGFARTTGDRGPLVADFATFDPSDRALFANALAKCGTAYLGVDLATADMDTSITWDTTTPGDQKPGSWGGHCLIAWDYTGLGDADVVRLATWGTLQPVTWRWLASRCEEAHVLIWRQLMPAGGKNFAALDYDSLKQANMEWSA
jgi:hypothetical protein